MRSELVSECEHALELGAEKDERIDLLREEIARMQEERMAADAGNLEENLKKEILDLQAKYEQACGIVGEFVHWCSAVCANRWVWACVCEWVRFSQEFHTPRNAPDDANVAACELP